MSEVHGRCPVCRARFRGTAECSRCGADLSSLMQITVRAWRLRRQARIALGDGCFDEALRLARASRALHDLPAARAIETIASSLTR